MTQIARLTNELVKIKPEVTSKDRSACAEALGLHSNTIHNYLNGEGKSADRAYDILNFLKKRIAQRNKIIA